MLEHTPYKLVQRYPVFLGIGEHTGAESRKATQGIHCLGDQLLLVFHRAWVFLMYIKVLQRLYYFANLLAPFVPAIVD